MLNHVLQRKGKDSPMPSSNIRASRVLFLHSPKVSLQMQCPIRKPKQDVAADAKS